MLALVLDVWVEPWSSSQLRSFASPGPGRKLKGSSLIPHTGNHLSHTLSSEKLRRKFFPLTIAMPLFTKPDWKWHFPFTVTCKGYTEQSHSIFIRSCTVSIRSLSWHLFHLTQSVSKCGIKRNLNKHHSFNGKHHKPFLHLKLYWFSKQEFSFQNSTTNTPLHYWRKMCIYLIGFTRALIIRFK